MLIPNHRATAVLHPGAVYKGQQLNTQVVRIVTANVDNIESKVREVEQRMGIKSSDMISVTYERQSENIGRGIAMLIGLALVVLAFRGFQAMSKNVRSSMGGAGANREAIPCLGCVRCLRDRLCLSRRTLTAGALAGHSPPLSEQDDVGCSNPVSGSSSYPLGSG